MSHDVKQQFIVLEQNIDALCTHIEQENYSWRHMDVEKLNTMVPQKEFLAENYAQISTLFVTQNLPMEIIRQHRPKVLKEKVGHLDVLTRENEMVPKAAFSVRDLLLNSLNKVLAPVQRPKVDGYNRFGTKGGLKRKAIDGGASAMNFCL